MNERYGIELSQADMRLLVHRLNKGEGIIIDKGRLDAKGREAQRRLITVRDTEVIVVWSPELSYILSVLPKRRQLPKLKRPGTNSNKRRKREGARPEKEAEYE